MATRLRCGHSAALAWIFGVFAIVLGVRSALAQEPGYRSVDGLAVYLGVVPAEIVKGHPKAHPERTMHDETPRDEHAFHVVVAVFDGATGARLEDLAVRATLLPPARPPLTEPLERMTVAGAVTYGNFVRLAGYGTYRIRVAIERPGGEKPVVAEFAYEHRLR